MIAAIESPEERFYRRVESSLKNQPNPKVLLVLGLTEIKEVCRVTDRIPLLRVTVSSDLFSDGLLP